jgi:uncharacterized protein YdgA (DUF945 family)
MKKVIGSVTTLAALVLASYYSTGFVTERTLKKNLVMIDQTSGLSVQIANYDRGLFTSQVKLVCQVQTPDHFVKNEAGDMTLVPSKAFTLDMPITIYHGPVIYAGNHGVHFGLGYANSELVLPEAYLAQFTKDYTADSTTPKIDLSLFVTYLNKTMLHLDIPAFHVVTKLDKSQLDWLGLKSEHTFSSNMNEAEGDVVVDGVRLTQGDNVAVIEKLVSTYDLHRSSLGLYLGDVSINIPTFTVMQKDVKEFELQSLQVASSSDVEENLFGSSFHASFEKMQSHDKNYGPGRMSFSIKNLDAPTLVEINQKMGEMQRGSDTQRQQAALAVLPDLPKLFGKGAMIEVSELNVVGPDGEVDGSLHVTLPKGNEGNPFQLMQKIEGAGKLKMPCSLFKSMIVHSEKKKLLAASAASEKQNISSEAPSTPDQTAPTLATKTQETSAAAPEVIAMKDSNPMSAGIDGSVSKQPIQDTSPTVTESVPTPSSVTIEAQADSEADKCIDRLIKAGTIVKKDTDYLIDVKLSGGQFSVNGRQLSADMLQF